MIDSPNTRSKGNSHTNTVKSRSDTSPAFNFSTSKINLTETVLHSNENRGVQPFNPNDTEKSADEIKEKQDELKIKLIKQENEESKVIKEEDNSVSDINDQNTSFEKYEKNKLDELDEMYNNNLANNDTENEGNFENGNRNAINSFFQSGFDSKHIGPKQKQVFGDIKINLEQFVNEFNFYFYEHVFQRFTEHIQKLMDEKYLKYIEISKNYHGQIKEMEFLMTGDGEDQHKDQIRSILESLKEEQEHELDRIEDHYNRLVIDAQNNFKSIGIKSNPGIQLIEEKFKLDMYNMINMILVPKNK